MDGSRKLMLLGALTIIPLVLGQSCASAPSDGTSGATGATGPTGPQGPAGANGTNGTDGTNGTNGADGADGQLRIYGNGSAGAKTVDSNSFDDSNLQYTDFTINAGVTLTIPSGLIIRCTGTFTNNGNLVVGVGAIGGGQRSGTSAIVDATFPPEAGISLRAPGIGELGDNTVFLRAGGAAGVGVGNASSARFILSPGIKAGGAGAAGKGISSANGVFLGGDGGGSLTVLARTAILNVGSITANGRNGDVGGGGGGGGIVILACPGSVTNSGSVTANGGAGGSSDSANGAGAGGAGGAGLIHLISPTISKGTTSVAPGTPGTSTGTVAAGTLRQGGGGGGACIGGGGRGAGILGTGIFVSAEGGFEGLVLETQADPTALFP